MTSAFGLFASAVLLAFAASGCGQKTEAQGPSGPPAMPVQVEIARSIRIPETTEYLSVLKSRQSAMINPQVEGQVTRIYVNSGDDVTAGTPLLQIDPLKQKATVSSQEAARASQEATMQLAKVNFERSQKLFAAGVISKQELDSAQSSFDSAQAQLKSLSDQVEQQRVELRYYDVSAPVDGIVGDIPVRVGDRVTVSTLLTTVNLPGALEAYIYVPGDRAKDLRLGLPVTLLDENGNSVSETHITFVSPQVETDTQTVLAKAQVSNPRAKLRISQQVRAVITWGSHEGPVVPILAITRINGQSFAFVAVHEAKGTVARQKLLKVGDTIGNDYAVLDGLKAGDHIIVSGTQFLQDGTPVFEQIQKNGDNSASQGAATP